MDKNSKIFITKDALFRSYLPTYGNTFWKTPNIDELAMKGTVFYRHYTGAPSTIMANMCMFTGKYAHENQMRDYIVSNMSSGNTLFDKAEELGFHSHIIWNDSWTKGKTVEYYNCYGKNTVFHPLPKLKQGVGSHYIHKSFLQKDPSKTENVYNTIRDEITEIAQESGKVFLWIHIPHVINGRTGYGQDIDAFDQIVGIAREFFSDNEIYISADHGNMNGVKNKLCYGFDVYEPAILIPMISPRIDNLKENTSLTSNIDLFELIFNKKIIKRDIIYSDSAFYAQPNRKLAIVTDRFKYIYNKFSDTEELYDLYYDPNENCNIMQDYVFDIDRRCKAPLRELYFYPYWEIAEEMRNQLRQEKNRIWRKGNRTEEFYKKIKYIIIILLFFKIKKYVLKLKGITDGSDK